MLSPIEKELLLKDVAAYQRLVGKSQVPQQTMFVRWKMFHSPEPTKDEVKLALWMDDVRKLSLPILE
jgi:hypothetical protein